MKMKLAAVTVLVLLGSLAVSAGEPPEGHGPHDPVTDEFYASDVGGGGWLHSGTFHPLDPDVILIGTDVTGGVYRTDNFGESWEPWNEGLSNYDHMWSMYVEDMVGVVETDGTVAFYAATHGGLYRAPDDGPWDWAGDDQPRDGNGLVGPAMSMVYWRENDDQFGDKRYHREPISFSCLDWNGDNLIAAGAGRVRWNNQSYEEWNYPGIDPELLYGVLECDPEGADPEYPCNPQLSPVWVHDLDNPENGWQPLDAPDGLGTPRDISMTRIDGNDYLAVATTTGIYLYDFSASLWHDLTDNFYYHEEFLPTPTQIPYGVDLTAWSIHLTQRGTLFAAMQRLDGTLPSGVYRVSQATIYQEMPWVWVGDSEEVWPFLGYSLWDIGLGEHFFGQPDLIYLTVVDGEGEDPDTLYLGDRRTNFGLLKVEQPLDLIGGEAFIPCHWSVSATNTSWSTWYPYNFDEGWGDVWGPQVIFHPVVMPGSSPHKLVVQFNGRLHVSDDGGISWDQVYCEEDDDAWTSLGYNEHSIRGATFLTDGRPVFSAGDTGTFASVDVEGSAYEYIHPEILWNSVQTDDAISNTETSSLQVRPLWGGGEKDALFINYGDVVQKSWYGKLFMHLYDREDGPSNDPNTWFNITKTIPELDHYLFGDFDFIDDETCLLSYIRYTGPVGLSGSVPEGYGVFKGVFQGFSAEEPIWTWMDWSDGLPEGDGYSSYAVDLLHNSYNGDRIFLTVRRTKDVGGGLFVLEGPNFTTWELIINAYIDDTYWNQYRDFRALAQSEDGSYLYVGSRGSSSGIGGLLLCKDPSRATDMRKWQVLANDPDNTIRPFQFYLNLPFWSTTFRTWAVRIISTRT